MFKPSQKIDFIGIGDQKSASTWIFNCLRDHPKICCSEKKETRFFDHDHLYEQGPKRYREFFSHCGEDKKIGEYSPSYIHSEKALQRIKEHYPDVKLIISFRDPVEKMFSEYRFNKVSGTGAMMQYDSFLQAVQDRASLIQRAKHGDNLERVFKHFSKDQVFVGIYDDIKNNPKKFMQEVYSFLEVNNDFVSDSISQKHKVTGAKRFKSKAITNLIVKFSEFVKKNQILKDTLERVGGRKIQSKILQLNKVSEDKHGKAHTEELKKETESIVRTKFLNDIEKLEELIDRDLSNWK